MLATRTSPDHGGAQDLGPPKPYLGEYAMHTSPRNKDDRRDLPTSLEAPKLGSVDNLNTRRSRDDFPESAASETTTLLGALVSEKPLGMGWGDATIMRKSAVCQATQTW